MSYIETDRTFKGQQIFLKSTGNTQKDIKRAEEFSKWLKNLVEDDLKSKSAASKALQYGDWRDVYG